MQDKKTKLGEKIVMKERIVPQALKRKTTQHLKDLERTKVIKSRNPTGEIL